MEGREAGGRATGIHRNKRGRSGRVPESGSPQDAASASGQTGAGRQQAMPGRQEESPALYLQTPWHF
jgi:hypothetical protein